MTTPIRTGLAAMTVALSAQMSGAQDLGYAETLYQQNCIACHGEGGGGMGPLAEFLHVAVPNLTTISARSDGTFPFGQVYEVIDGRREVRAHGTVEMPVWGSVFDAEALPRTVHPGVSADDIVQGRILALVYYIQSIQAE